jgi:hypothetical protein
MSSRAIRWFGGLVAGLVVLSVASLIPGTGLGPTKTTQAQPYAAPAAVGGVAGGAEQPGAAPNSCRFHLFGQCIIP